MDGIGLLSNWQLNSLIILFYCSSEIYFFVTKKRSILHILIYCINGNRLLISVRPSYYPYSITLFIRTKLNIPMVFGGPFSQRISWMLTYCVSLMIIKKKLTKPFSHDVNYTNIFFKYIVTVWTLFAKLPSI